MQQVSPHPHLTLINPSGLYDPAPNGYSHVALLATGARLAIISGQGGETADGILAQDFRAQVRQAFINLATAVAAVGGKIDQIAKLTLLIVDHNHDKLQIFGEELERALGTAMKPACTLIPVPCLALDGMLFEVEAWVVI